MEKPILEMLNFKVRSIESILGIPFQGESIADKEDFVEKHWEERVKATDNLLDDAFDEMSGFDYLFLEDGPDMNFIAHAKKYTKEEAITHFLEVVGMVTDENTLRKPIMDDVENGRVKYFEEDPESSFPVWVIDIGKLRIENSLLD